MPNLVELIKTIKESKKTLFILCGFPYAGKSFVAEELRKHTDIVVVSIDTIFQKHGYNWDTNTLPATEGWQKIFDESYELVRGALGNEMNVLYDSTNQTIASRDKLRWIAKLIDANTQVIFIKSPVETVWKRWTDNQNNPNRSVVNKELVQITIDMFEEPTDSEDVIIINN